MFPAILIDQELKNNVREAFINHHEYYKIADEIFADTRFYLKKNLEQSLNLIEIYNELYKWKRTSQLLLNLYNDYELFEDFKFRFKNKECNVSEFNSNVSKPGQEDVIDALYLFVYYYLLANREENRQQREKIIEEISMGNYKCNICDTPFEANDIICSVCGESVEELIKMADEKDIVICKENDPMAKSVSNLDLSNILELKDPFNFESREYWICDICMTCNVAVEHCGTCGRKCCWTQIKKCTKCGVIHSSEEDLCFNCKSSWKCWYRLCRNINFGSEEFCQFCGLERIPQKVPVKKVRLYSHGIVKRVWICDKCDQINSDMRMVVCGHCGISRYFVMKYVAKEDEFILIDEMGDVQTVDYYILPDKWECIVCQFINEHRSKCCKVCLTERLQMWTCEHCSIDNKILNKYCVVCSSVRESCDRCHDNASAVSDGLCSVCLEDQVHWECWYMLCSRRNYGDGKFCKYCGLERYHNALKCAPVWQRIDTRIEEKWVCDKCYLINDKENTRCVNRDCNSSRIMIYRWCSNCAHGNSKRFGALKCAVCRQWLCKIFQ